jgi:hypothetical protein
VSILYCIVLYRIIHSIKAISVGKLSATTTTTINNYNNNNTTTMSLPSTGHHRAKSIETELEQLLSMNENCNDDNDEDRGLDSKSTSTGNSSKSKETRRKIKYSRDDDPQHENTDTKSVKSNKSKSSTARSRSGRSRNKEGQDSSSTSGINNNDNTNSFAEDDDSNNNSNINNNRSPLVRTKSGSARSRDSRKIRYNDNETTTLPIEERDRDGKSVISKESARSRKADVSKDSNNCPNNSNSRSTAPTTTPTTTEEEERSSKSRRNRRTIKYQKDDVVSESAQERDKDARSTRSSGTRDSARSSRSRTHDDNNNKKKAVTGTTLFGESSSSSSLHDPISSRRRKVVKALDEKNDLPDEFEDWTTGDEEIPINDNNNNDDDLATKPRELRRGINRSHSTLDRRGQQRTRRGGLMRSMSQDVTLTQGTRAQLDENGKYDDEESHGIELNSNDNSSNNNNNNNNNSRGTAMRSELPSRRIPRSGSIKIASVGMVLGDPSRRAPPSRCKSQSQGTSRESVLSSSRQAKGPPSRSQSNDFAVFLRQGTKLQQQQRPSMRISSVQQGVENFGKFGMEDDDNDDNPFEVINKGPYDSKSSREIIDDMFDVPNNNNNNNNEDVHSSSDRRGNMTASKSGGLLQLKASSKDTMRVSARTKIVVTTDDEEKQSIQDTKIEREKQRRAEYNKSIAAASSAGRIRMSRRPSHRQVKRQNSSSLGDSNLGDSFSKLEATLEAE